VACVGVGEESSERLQLDSASGERRWEATRQPLGIATRSRRARWHSRICGARGPAA